MQQPRARAGPQKLSQEEALGWLLAHARGRRLLVEEARPIGKVAAKQAGVAKQQCTTSE